MRTQHVGKHRLGTPGLVHCAEIRSVADALAEYRRGWLATLMVPARHSLAGLRKRARATARESILAPAT